MQRLLGLTFLTLSLAVPPASLALGLGDIRVESALHQPLVAQIELVGAIDEELGRLSATIASDEAFLRYGLERAPFIYGTTLSVGHDGQGRPVLNVRSTDKFTEPVVTLLVDLHTPHGELIREYTLFLDPPGLTTGTSEPKSVAQTTTMPAVAAGAEPAAASGAVRAADAGTLRAVASSAERSGTTTSPVRAVTNSNTGVDANNKLLGHTYTVARRDTLARIVSATGAHSRTDRHRMMIAIFRANPAAFQNNFNRLRTGVTLQLPTAEQLAAISAEEVSREYDAQMAAWRAPGHRVASSVAAVPAAPVSLASRAAPAVPTQPPSSVPVSANNDIDSETDRAVLTQRVASLEQSLDRLRQELKQPLVVQKAAAAVPPATISAAAVATTAEATDEDDEDQPTPASHRALQLISSAVGVGLVLMAGTLFYLRRRNSPAASPAISGAKLTTENDETVEFSNAPPPIPQIPVSVPRPVQTATGAPQQAMPKVTKNESSWFEDSFSTPIGELLANDPTISIVPQMTAELPVDATAKLPVATAEGADTTVLLAPDFEVVGDTVEQKFSFFNPEATTNTEHVVMGSGLNEPKNFVERRRNPADVLRQAIEREPQRSDLRLKLLELYYTAAEENRQAFLEATRQLAKNAKLASPEEWSRIMEMGRAIAPDDELFSDELDDKRVATLLSA
ncbi:MAG: pilus assembly protein FimV [Gammaproteobacteria bacterium]|jgi:pilus assembly protein FimV|nr:pilus assembly protein FimV [Gammaproteobacteria bacterium]